MNSPPVLAPLAWQSELADAYPDPRSLLIDLNLDPADFPSLGDAAARFPFRVTRSYARRMTQGNPADPLLLQVLPVAAELRDHPDFLPDPVGDLRAEAGAGVLHKYSGRVLLVTTGACAIHCRYCFRREFPYAGHSLSHRNEREALAYIASDPTVREVILSGGDPLVLGDARLAALVAGLAAIPHLRRLRLHSRLPIVLPSRQTPELAAALTSTRLPVTLVVHANHPAELNAEVGAGLAVLRAAGITLLNQAVLLRGINDRAETLTRLSEELFDHGVLPYYLHLLDRARGTEHFDVSAATGLTLVARMRERLPGYLVPRLVREVPGERAKQMVG